MKNKIAMMLAAMAAMFAACVANAETYYFQGVPGVKTVATGTDKWKTEEGSSFAAVKSVTATSYAITDGSAVCIITNGQIAATSLNPDANAYGLFGGLLELRGTSGSEALFINNGICNQFNLKLGPDGSFKFGGRAWKGYDSLLQGNSKIEVGADTSYEHPARIYIFNATEKPSGSGNNTPASAAQIGGSSGDGSITGSGFLRFETTGKNNEGTCNLSMYSDCSKYVGSIAIVGNASHQQIFGSYHSSALGGEPQEFLPKGLELDYAWLAQFAAVNTGANRGLWIANDSVVHFNNGGNLPLTINGAFAFANSEVKLKKRGTSTLSLLGGLQDNAALGIFDITDGTLEIGGADVVEATFTGTATLKASQSATVKPRAASTFSGALNVADTAALDLANISTLQASVSMSSGTTLRLGDVAGNGYSAPTLNSFAVSSSIVQVFFGETRPVPGQTYDILKTATAMTAATAENLYNPLGTFQLSDGDCTLQFVASTDPGYVWTGNGNDNCINTPANWACNAAPTNGATLVVLDVSGILTLNETISPSAIEFVGITDSLTIVQNPDAAITGIGAIVNRSSSMPVVNVPVTFGDGTADIDVTGAVDFAGGVTGARPVSHSTFHGNYTLTADTWVLTTPITLGTYATVTAKDVSAAVATVKSASIINTQAGSVFTVDNLTFSNNSANYRASLVGSHQGTLIVKGTAKVSTSVQAQLNIWSTSGSCTGAICVNRFEYSNANASDLFNFNVSDVVFGSGGLVCTRGRLYWSGKPLTWHSMADVSIGSIDYLSGSYNSSPTALKALAIDTTDWFDNTVGRTVTIAENWKCSYTCPLSAFGKGSVIFDCDFDKFTGGFTASNEVKVVLKAGSRPGSGAVTMKDSSSLVLPDAGTGTISLGALTFGEDAVLVVSNLTTSATVPLSVLSLSAEQGENGKKPWIVVGGTSRLEPGEYPICKLSSGMLDADVASRFSLDTRSVASKSSLLVDDGGILSLLVSKPGLTVLVF